MLQVGCTGECVSSEAGECFEGCRSGISARERDAKGEAEEAAADEEGSIEQVCLLAFGCDFYPYAANPNTLSRKPLGTGNIDRRIQAEICFGGDGERVRTEQHQLT